MDALKRYLKKRGVTGCWGLEGVLPESPLGAVVIPSLAEGEELFATLDSLDGCAPELRRRFAVVVVVNRSEAEGGELQEINRGDLASLTARSDMNPELPLAWVDASSEGCALPAREAGVGLARKLGFDLFLKAFPGMAGSGVLASLDADTLVEASYLSALVEHFAVSSAGGCAVPFVHRFSSDPGIQDAIERYELYLRAYVAGLESAGSPYAFHTVGSAMACRVEAYVRAGGMSRRKAAEDFYFLQQLAKVGGVETLQGATVFPSPRVSRRTPFGTGQVVARQMEQGGAVSFYPPESYEVLGEWLKLALSGHVLSGDEVLNRAASINGDLQSFLERLGFGSAWEKLKQNYLRPEEFRRGFHAWFDGLRTVQLLHALENSWSRSSELQIVARQFGWADRPSCATMLGRLRCEQGVENACRC